MGDLKDITGMDWFKALPEGRVASLEEAREIGLEKIIKAIKGGFFRNNVRTEEEVIQIIMSTGITNDSESARGLVRYLETNRVFCSNDYLRRIYTLKRVNYRDGKEGLEIRRIPVGWFA